MIQADKPDSALLPSLLAQAFADRIARRRGQEGRYQLANGMGAMLDADDASGRHEWLIAPLLLQGSASPDARILLALPLDIEVLIQACPELLQRRNPAPAAQTRNDALVHAGRALPRLAGKPA